MDREGKIGAYYSTALSRILKSEDLSGRTLISVLREYLDESMINTLNEYIGFCFDPGFSGRHVEKLNPLRELEIFIDTGRSDFQKITLSFLFKRIEKEKEITHLMVLVRDITEQKTLSEEMERNRQKSRGEMELLYKILHVDPSVLKDFLSGSERDIEAINRELKHGKGDYVDRLDHIFRHTHAVKGDADLLQLDFLAEKGEELEQLILSLKKKKELKAEDFLPLTLSFGDMRETLLKINKLLDQFRSFHSQIGPSFVTPGKDISFMDKSLISLTGRLAERHGVCND